MGIVLVGLLPLILHILDGIANSGGSVSVGSVRIQLSAAVGASRSPVVPRNAGLQPGERLTDSGNAKILETLKTAHASSVVEVDLEDGTAWWETRLLILASGASRLDRPRAFVFTCIRGGVPHWYIGWAEPEAVRDRLLHERPALRRAHQRASAITSQWTLHGPQSGGVPADPTPLPEPPYSYLVRRQDGLQDPLRDEQILSATLADLESPVEGEPTQVTAKGLEALLDTVLHTHSVDQAVDDREWMKAVLATEDHYVAVTNKGQYVALMSRTAVTNAALAALTDSTTRS